MKAVGMREIGAFLRGETLETAAKAAKQATRRFAKRQSRGCGTSSARILW